jgi:hypothetical protein
MQIIIDRRLPDEAKTNLAKYGELIPFETIGITAAPLSGHPDIFFCQNGNTLIASPDIPEKFIDILKEKKIKVIFGKHVTGAEYPSCAHYNAVVTEKYLIHNLSLTDEVILKSATDKKKLNVKQGFTRCSLLMLDEENFITSDKSTVKTLEAEGLHGLWVSPRDVILPGYEHGLFGGTSGVCGKDIFICGSLNHFVDGVKVKAFAERLNYRIVELYDGPLFDGGGILFLE